jgi:hypothetical protein
MGTRKQKRKTTAATVNEKMNFVRKFAPSLICLRATLLPFEDVILEESAGPQPDTPDDVPDAAPYFTVTVNDPQYEQATVTFHFNAKTITAAHIMYDDGEPVLADGPREMTLDAVFNYLRQLPRPITSF